MSKRLGALILVFILILPFTLSNPAASVRAEGDAPSNSTVLSKVSFYKADLVAVLQQLASESGYNVIIAPEITGTVTVQLTRVTFEEALKLILEGQGLVYRQEGRNFFITKPGKLPSDQPIVGYFHVYYAEPSRVAEILQKLTGVTEISADERTRTIMVTGSKTVLDKVAAVINSVDRKMPQITMEVKVVEISNSDLRELGAEWRIDDSGLNWGLSQSGTELIIQMLNSGHSWGVIFNNLASKGGARLVTSPSVSAVDSQEASILIGNKVPIQTKDKDGNITITMIDVGVKLIFTPRIQQGDEIAIDLKTQVNSLGEKTGDWYIINAREINSKIQAKIGETVFLGGLITQEEREKIMKVPGLGDIFLIGKLFQRTEKKLEDTELIVTITPKWNVPIRVEQEGTQP